MTEHIKSTLPWILSTYIERDIRQTINIRRHMDFVKGITQFRKIASTAQKGYIVYAGELTPDLPHAKVLRFIEVEKIFK